MKDGFRYFAIPHESFTILPLSNWTLRAQRPTAIAADSKPACRGRHDTSSPWRQDQRQICKLLFLPVAGHPHKLLLLPVAGHPRKLLLLPVASRPHKLLLLPAVWSTRAAAARPVSAAGYAAWLAAGDGWGGGLPATAAANEPFPLLTCCLRLISFFSGFSSLSGSWSSWNKGQKKGRASVLSWMRK
jgi:hypothetical protein